MEKYADKKTRGWVHHAVVLVLLVTGLHLWCPWVLPYHTALSEAETLTHTEHDLLERKAALDKETKRVQTVTHMMERGDPFILEREAKKRGYLKPNEIDLSKVPNPELNPRGNP